jgi:hypothetical protein
MSQLKLSNVSPPAAPSSGKVTLYADGDQIYYIDYLGNITGPIGVGGGGGDNFFFSEVDKFIEASGSLILSESLLSSYLSASFGAEISGSVVFAGLGGFTTGSDALFFVSGSIGSKDGITPGVSVFGGDVHVSGNVSADGDATVSDFLAVGQNLQVVGLLGVTGSAQFLGGVTGSFTGTMTGSHTEITPGIAFIVPGDSSIDIVTASNGQIQITSTGGGSSAEYWKSDVNDAIWASGSVLIRGADTTTATSDYGTDTFFFVSGSTQDNSSKKAVFGGTTFVSGNLQVPFNTPIQSRGTGSAWIGIARYINASPAYGAQILLIGDPDYNTTGIGLNSDGRTLALISGSGGYFSGSYMFHDGISGSLTQLTDGTSYLVAGQNITITTASNGQVTIEATAGGGSSPQFWFSTGSNEVYTTGSVLVRAGLSATPAISKIEFDVSGSEYSIYSDANGTLHPYNGSLLKSKDIEVADASYSWLSGSITISSTTVLASGSGGDISLYSGHGGWDASVSRDGGFIDLIAGNGGNTDNLGVGDAGPGGSINITAGAPGWNGGAFQVGEEGKAGDIRILGGVITPISRSINGSWLIIGDPASSSSFAYIGFDDSDIGATNYFSTTDTYFFVSGSVGSRGTADRGTAVFGGDVVISGTLWGGSPLKIGSGLQITGSLLVSGSDSTLEMFGGYRLYPTGVSTLPYTASQTDYIIAVSASVGVNPHGVELRPFEYGRTFVVKDVSGSAAADNITVTAEGGELIDGASSYVLSINRGSATFVYFGPTTGWGVV